jgi:hypothetical protein
MSESETPRTDEAAFVVRDDKHGLLDVTHLAFAEELETELSNLTTGLKNLLEQWKEDKLAQIKKSEWHKQRFDRFKDNDDMLHSQAFSAHAANIMTRIEGVNDLLNQTILQ